MRTLTVAMRPMKVNLTSECTHVHAEVAITRKDAGDFRKAWRAICVAAGLPNLLIHDLRRTAVRNLRRPGFSEKTILDISCHKTAAVFRRYDLTDESDVNESQRN
ncbi:MAG TPA: hypothetical protein VM912_07740 [Terriglobales bacterium]|nr:hypothetical protein [Terriglobales bacterium]